LPMLFFCCIVLNQTGIDLQAAFDKRWIWNLSEIKPS
jgi:hypothetical protein